MNKIYNNIVLQVIMIAVLVFAEIALQVSAIKFEKQPQVFVEVRQVQSTVQKMHTRMAEVTVLTKQIDVYTYRLDKNGEVIWTPADKVEIGELVKTGICQADGYAQVEYPDLDNAGWWKVAYQRCEYATH